MGYIDRQATMIAYTPSDAIIISNDAIGAINGDWVKVKEIKIIGVIYGESRFRFKFDLKSGTAGHTVYGRIYKNGVAVGVTQSDVTGGYVTKTEDINLGAWTVNDLIQLYTMWDSGSSVSAYVQNFRLCGASAPMINTMV